MSGTKPAPPEKVIPLRHPGNPDDAGPIRRDHDIKPLSPWPAPPAPRPSDRPAPRLPGK